MLVTFLITFREGLEAFLILGILLTYLSRIGAGRQAIWIWVGALMGIVASVVAAFILQVVVDQFNNERYRAMLTIAIMLTAVCILAYMALWMQKQAREHTRTAQARLEDHVSAGRILGITTLGFVSVLREGIETVLFLSALGYSGQTVSPLWGVLGLLASGVIVWAVMRTTRRVPLSSFFRGSSLLLLIIAAGLLGSAVNQLQALGVKLGSDAPVFDISHILSDAMGFGIFLRGLFGYNATPTLAQLVAWAGFLGISVLLWSRGGKVQA